MYHSSGQNERRSNVYSNDFLAQSFGNSRPSRGRPHWMFRDSHRPDGMRYEESRFPVRSRGPTLHQNRYWGSDNSFDHGHRSNSPSTSSSSYHYSSSTNYMPRTTFPQVTQMNERHKWQFGNHSYQVERRYTRPVVDQFSWNGAQQSHGSTGYGAETEEQTAEQNAKNEDQYEDSWEAFQSDYAQHSVANRTFESGVADVDQQTSSMEEDFIPLNGNAREVNKASENLPDEGTTVPNFEDSEGVCDSDDEDIVIIGEKRGSSGPPKRSDEVLTIEVPTRPKPSSPYEKVPSQYFYCHLCSKHLDHATSFKNHIDSQDHRMMLNMLEEGNGLRVQLLRFEAKRQERKCFSDTQNRRNRQQFCTFCNVNYTGDYAQHQECSIHRRLQDILAPFCRLCKLEFGSAMEREIHRLSVEHLLAREKADERSLANVLKNTCVQVVNLNENSDDDANQVNSVNSNDQSNEVSGDSLCSSEDIRDVPQRSSTPEKEISEDQSAQLLTDETAEPEIQEVRAFFCRICEEYFQFEEEARQLHCQTVKHKNAMQAQPSEEKEPESTQVASCSIESLDQIPRNEGGLASIEDSGLSSSPAAGPSLEFAIEDLALEPSGSTATNQAVDSPVPVSNDPPPTTAFPQSQSSESVVQANSPVKSGTSTSSISENHHQTPSAATALNDVPNPTSDSSCVHSSSQLPTESKENPATGSTQMETNELAMSVPADDPYVELLKESKELKPMIRRIRNGAKVMIALQGIPGSGKTHLANRLKGRNGIIVSHDNAVTDLRGKYIWTKESLAFAKSATFKKAYEAAESGNDVIVIDNHNLAAADISPYMAIARTFKYRFYTVEPTTPWKYNLEICAKKNVHGLTLNQVREISEPFLKQKLKKLKKLQNKAESNVPQKRILSEEMKKPPPKKQRQ